MTPEFKERFTALFNQPRELEYAEIARILNHEFKLVLTRSAISGLARRAGLKRRLAYSGGRIPKAPKAAPAPRHVAKGGNTLGDRKARKHAAALASAAVEAEALALGNYSEDAFNGRNVQGLRAFMSLGSTHCRWPYDCDDGVMRYCPNRKPDSSEIQYCVTHHRLAHRH